MTDEWERPSDVVLELGQRCEIRHAGPFHQDLPKMLEHPTLAGAWTPEILGFHCDEGLVLPSERYLLESGVLKNLILLVVTITTGIAFVVALDLPWWGTLAGIWLSLFFARANIEL